MKDFKFKEGEAVLLLLLSFFLFAASAFPGTYGAVFFFLIPFLRALEKRTSLKGAFLTGYGFGLLYLGFSFFWMVNISAAGFLFALFYQSLFPALFAAGYFVYKKGKGPRRAWLFAPFLWVSLEWLRSLGFLGMPAGVAGYHLMPRLSLAQAAAWFGVYGLSLIAAAVNCLFHAALSAGLGRAKRLALAAGALLFLLALDAAGGARLRGAVFSDKIPVAVIQGNITPEKKWSAGFLEELLSVQEQMTREARAGKPGLIIWPETAVPAFLFHPERKSVLERVGALAREGGIPLLTGAQDYRQEGGKKIVHNSAVLFSGTGEVVDTYAKIHLFPVMEHSPWDALTPFLRRLGLPAAYTPGERFTLFESNGVRFSTLICFEIFFPELVRRYVEEGAEVLVNLTNDAPALGKMPVYYEAAANMSRMRAVEFGRSLVRAANNGYSLAADPAGRILKKSALSSREILTAEVPSKGTETFYFRSGHLWIYLCVFLALLGFLRRSSR